jgi:beta-lactamase regulating signal transducer with metallopeptidase domain
MGGDIVAKEKQKFTWAKAFAIMFIAVMIFYFWIIAIVVGGIAFLIYTIVKRRKAKRGSHNW